jgi:hypothetical protein
MRQCSIITGGALVVLMLASATAWGQPPASQPQTQRGVPVPDPYLVILRDPAVQRDLQITAAQKHSIAQVTDALDEGLWVLRDYPPEQSADKLAALIAKAETPVKGILDASQQKRLEQIRLRVQGIAALRRPDIADALKLTADQRTQIQKLAEETQTAVRDLQKQAGSGKSFEALTQEATKLRTDEQTKTLAIITRPQQSQWAALMGRDFDVKQVGRPPIKAPELRGVNDWVNSQPLTLANLHGRVVVLNYLTYG